MDTVEVQVWECLLHNKNSIYHHNYEQELFLDLTYYNNRKDFQNTKEYVTDLKIKSKYPNRMIKNLFYFAHNELIDPLHIKYLDYIYSLHPGHTRILGKTLFSNYFNPVSCILYAEANKKLLPIKGLEVLNKLELIDISAEQWKDQPIMTDQNIINRYTKTLNTSFKSGNDFWSEHTNNLYRIFFEDRHCVIFPNEDNLEFNKRIDVNIEDFSGTLEAIKYVFKCIENDRHN